MRILLAASFLSASAIACAAPAFARQGDKILGVVHFETSCTPSAQTLFDRAMLYQHSFWYSRSQGLFRPPEKARLLLQLALTKTNVWAMVEQYFNTY